MRSIRLLPPAALALATLAACADAPTSVAAAGPGAAAAPRAAKLPAAQSWKVGDTTVTTMWVDPLAPVSYGISGEHKITFPSNTICDPARSSYGPGTWDAACTLASQPLQVTARSWRDKDGRPRVDFQPALRFVPNARGELEVLYLKDKEAAASGTWKILYCADGAAECVDESLTDPSLATRYDLKSAYVYRTLKHFSGYSVGVGRESEY